MVVSPKYMAFYCEENVWWLAQEPGLGAQERWAVFISNPMKLCALWSQRAAAAQGAPVVWDYHVILLTYASAGGWSVWDLDCVVGCPLPARLWSEVTFPHAFPGASFRVKPEYGPCFRLVPGDAFVEGFRSDRAHMRDPASGAYLQPPPPWAVISPGENNLGLFVEADPQKAAFAGSTLLDWSGWLARTESA